VVHTRLSDSIRSALVTLFSRSTKRIVINNELLAGACPGRDRRLFCRHSL
jgi:hypothetical protein